MNKTLSTLMISSLFYSLLCTTPAWSKEKSEGKEHQLETHAETDHENKHSNEHEDQHATDDKLGSDHDNEHDDGHKDKLESDHDSDHADEHADEHEPAISLSAKQIELAQITVNTLELRRMNYQIYTPGEIVANGYTSYLVSPRVDSVVLRRHVALGDHVEKDQPLITLFSETVATAQGNFQISAAEWQRVQTLGRKAVGEKRYVTARSGYQANYGRLQAYGLSTAVIDSLKKNSTAAPLGEYTLNAATAGAVLSDDFQQGQRVAAGASLMLLADESALWVEARLSPNMQLQLPAGTKASVKVGGDLFVAEVTQKAHTIDPRTRTRIVRLEVANPFHRLHPGMFADVLFTFSTDQPVLAVPEAALVRNADGDWSVFIEKKEGEFEAQEITLGRQLGKWREISGIPTHSRVVTAGAFFIASQIAKGGFDPHNH